MSEKTLVARIQDVLGTTDTVLAAASFERRGEAGGLTGGGMVGGTIGHALGGGIGGAIGDLAGAAVGFEEGNRRGGFGEHAEGELQKVPLLSTVAASETHLYAWAYELTHGHMQPTEAIFAFERADVVVSVHTRLVVHTFEVQHVPSSRRWEFEADRAGSHLKSLLAVLKEIPAAAPSV